MPGLVCRIMIRPKEQRRSATTSEQPNGMRNRRPHLRIDEESLAEAGAVHFRPVGNPALGVSPARLPVGNR
jgi:hypothetical protein